MIQILMNNALESWALAIHYCNEIMEGKATLGNRKCFVSSLQNAIELFIKQYMLNICDYRVCKAKDIEANGEPMVSYLSATNLNNYFYELQKEDKTSMKKFISAEFNKLIEWQKELFAEFYIQNPSNKEVIRNGLSALKELRNNETHFYIDEFYFLNENDFVNVYNFMISFFELLIYYQLVGYWGEPFGVDKRFDFRRTSISSISYKKQLEKSQSASKIKQIIERELFLTESDDAYMLAENIRAVCNDLDCFKFDELWAYIQMLLKYKMLNI